MGGGSLQIAFATDGNNEGVEPGNLSKFNLGSHGTELEYSLFVTTHLGFGANVALSKHLESMKSESDRIEGKDNLSSVRCEYRCRRVTFLDQGNFPEFRIWKSIARHN